MKKFLLKLDAAIMTILCIPGIIIGLPYLISQTRKENKFLKEFKDALDK